MSSSTKKMPTARNRKGPAGEYAPIKDGDGKAVGRRVRFVKIGLGKSKQAQLDRSFPAGAAYGLTEESVKRLRAIERGRRMMESDLMAAGGTLSTQEVADHLEISPQAVDKQRQAGRLLAVTNPQGHFRYPAFQFTRPQVRQHLQAVLSRLDEDSPFVKLNWLLNPDSRLGAAPVDLLDRGDVEPVLRAADAFGHHVPS